jgi:LPS export ABC transporter protein LptC
LRVVRGILLACIIGGFVALFSVLNPPPNRMEGGEEVQGLETDEDILVEGLHYSEWEEDRVFWSMKAERALYHHQRKQVTFEQVEVTFFPSREGKMLLWANIVEYDLDSRNLVVREAVRGKSDQGYVFVTESLYYDGSKREVTTDDKVALEKDRLTIQGVGMEGSLVDHKFRILSGVHAVFSPQGTVP